MIIIPAILEGFKTLKDKTIRVTFDTNELTPDQLSHLSTSHQKFGYLVFKVEEFTQREQEAIEDLESSYEDKGKTHSQRLRNVLYRLYEQDKQGYQDFENFYKYRMETLINHFKNQLQ